MKVKEIKTIINGTGFSFETYHDFSGIHDRWIDNHNVLIKDNVRLVPINRTRSLWKALAQDTLKPIDDRILPLPELIKRYI